MDLKKLCNEVKHVARTTGTYLKNQQALLRHNEIELKGTRNYVTYIDKEAERMLVTALQELLPESGFLTEENTIAFEQRAFTWVIDPLDGTTNYVHGDTPFSVSIALMKEGKVILGVVFDPVADQMFSATEK
jgi:myo-inositol-1(or 4)-monophosphatase